jgi:hypothetical protein
MIINCGHPRRVFVYKLTFARIASFRTLPKTGVEIIKKRLLIYHPTLPKRLCLVFSNLCNNFKLIAVQSSAPFSSKRGVAPYILCTDSALQVILAAIKSATPRVEKEKCKEYANKKMQEATVEKHELLGW